MNSIVQITQKIKITILVSIFLSLCLALIYLLSGCSDLISTGCVNIEYNNNNYSLVHNWEIDSNDYELKAVEVDGENLNLRIYNDKSFILCENNGSVYHNMNDDFPKNETNNISKLTLLLDSNSISFDSSSTVDEFVEIINSKSQFNIEYTEIVATLSVSYNDSLAEFYCANVCVDSQKKYWLQYTVFDSEYNTFDFYYKINSDSKLLSVIKKNIV